MNVFDYPALGSAPHPSYSGGWSPFSQFVGISSLFAALLSPRLFDSLKLVLLGTLIEGGRRLFSWLVERFTFRYSMSAQFVQGDPAYEWIFHFLIQEEVWRKSRDFHVSARSSQRRWGVKTPAGSELVKDNAEYVPVYGEPHLFRWKGYWIEIKKSRDQMGSFPPPQFGGPNPVGSISLTFFTLKMSVLSEFVEETRQRYVESNRPRVVIHSADSVRKNMRFGPPGAQWQNVKTKFRRPLSTLVLEEGMVDSLLSDAREFLKMENWYVEAGIPHRRGYLLHGPPGTGKTSTIHAIAGELGLEIYTLSLASGHIDDGFLQTVTSNVPPHSILLIEDIDCAFPSRDDADEEESSDNLGMFPGGRQYIPGIPGANGRVTLSGLLNVIDGIGSEDGRLFFATTNHVDRLDPALLRPGRIDMKIQYKLASKAQTQALFMRFFPETRFTDDDLNAKNVAIAELACEFAAAIPEDEFSTADLQGYLLGYKSSPQLAATNVSNWIRHERAERAAKKKREREREEKKKKAKEKSAFDMHNRAGEAMAAGFGSMLQRNLGEKNNNHFHPALPPLLPVNGLGLGTVATTAPPQPPPSPPAESENLKSK
ncbi:hypothetical protein JAAARDRAFT_40099 [Jaapia argillacea MUCL 33604]|uniref:AAA+ ATPase domain-containing protein n=1 Tax=Jaapia argillacea MUCL 33604 TaxID=933084 RepID=A0A067PQ99_9AGAM|nr:hypothetical protein JAAARDRAFT_40099 [Jaapia argillacea MUCL 33604]